MVLGFDSDLELVPTVVAGVSTLLLTRRESLELVAGPATVLYLALLVFDSDPGVWSLE